MLNDSFVGINRIKVTFKFSRYLSRICRAGLTPIDATKIEQDYGNRILIFYHKLLLEKIQSTNLL